MHVVYGILLYCMIGFFIVTLLIKTKTIRPEGDETDGAMFIAFMVLWPIVAIIGTLVGICNLFLAYTRFLIRDAE